MHLVGVEPLAPKCIHVAGQSTPDDLLLLIVLQPCYELRFGSVEVQTVGRHLNARCANVANCTIHGHYCSQSIRC